MQKIYLAGPMTGIPDFNYPAFNAAAEQLRKMGFAVENPAEDGLPVDSNWEDHLRFAISRLLDCAVVFTLEGYEGSKGARLEIHIAKALKMPIVEYNQFSTVLAALNWRPQPQWKTLEFNTIKSISEGSDTRFDFARNIERALIIINSD